MKKYSFQRGAALLTATCMAFILALGCTACGGTNGSMGSGTGASAAAASTFLRKTEGTVAVADAGGVDVAPAACFSRNGAVGTPVRCQFIAILKIVNTHLDGRFPACLCPKILKYTKYSCDFGASTVEKSARRSAYRQFCELL